MSETQITIYDGITNPIDEAIRLGEQFAKSGMFGCTKPEQGTILALACMAEKKNPFDINRKYWIIEGKLTMRADAMLAEFMKRHKWKWLTSTNRGASAVIEVDGETATVSYTEEDAELAGLLGKSNWKKNPKQMYRARLVSDTVRMYDPDIVSGTYTPEEVSDFAPEEKPAKAQVVESDLEKLEKICEPYEEEINHLLKTEYLVINKDQNFRDLDPVSRLAVISTPNHPLIEAAIALRQSKESNER